MLFSRQLEGAFNSMKRPTMQNRAQRAGKIAMIHILWPTEVIKAAIPKNTAKAISEPMTSVFFEPFKRPFCISFGNSSNFTAK